MGIAARHRRGLGDRRRCRGEPGHQAFLRNPVSIYIGDISYSLYLVHWPVIVLLSAVAADNAYFVVAAAGLTFGLAIGSYHFVENPCAASLGAAPAR